MVILFQNLQPTNAQVNRTSYIVEKMTKNVLFLRTAIRTRKENHITLPHIPCDPGDDAIQITGFKITKFFVRSVLQWDGQY